MRQKLFELQWQEQLLSTRTPRHPDVLAIRQQVREVQRILDREMPKHDEAATALLTAERSQLASLSGRDESLVAERENYDATQDLNKHEVEIVELERRVKLLDANYETYAKGLEQSRIDEALKHDGISNLSVIQSPSFVATPAIPKKGLTLILAFFAAIGGGLGTIFLSDYLDETIHSVARQSAI